MNARDGRDLHDGAVLLERLLTAWAATPPEKRADIGPLSLDLMAALIGIGYRRTAARRTDDEWRTTRPGEPAHPDRVRAYADDIRRTLTTGPET